MNATLDIIIVNWNSGRQLHDCLESIITTNRDSFDLSRVVVIDNASSDGSVEALECMSLPLTVIHNSENRGFAAACNQGAKASTADYLLFLNPDTRLFANSLVKPIQFMQKSKNKKIGICGIQLVDEQGCVSPTCTRFPTPILFFYEMLGLTYLFPKRFSSYFMNQWEHTNSREVDHVIGAFYLVRRPVFESLRGFDEDFFVYLEDLDFSYRAHQIGWSSYYLADAQAYHKGGGTSEQVKALRLFYSLCSRILYGYKHFSWWSATSLMLGVLFLEPLARISFAIINGSFVQLQDTIKGYARLWLALLRKMFFQLGVYNSRYPEKRWKI
jgi:N-acetylglucosaminyl-diphospho-decaprenol L-rhamnosyltransferase